MSHTTMRPRKFKLESLPLVCYRCGANKKKAKCRQYGNNVWCLKCKGEIDRMSVQSSEDDVHHPFGFGSPQCQCKNGQLSSDCPLHAATKIAREKREELEIHERRKSAPTVWIYNKKKRRGHAA